MAGRGGFGNFRLGVSERETQLAIAEEQLKAMKKMSEVTDMLNQFELQKAAQDVLNIQQKQSAFSTLRDLTLPSNAPAEGQMGPPSKPGAGMNLAQILADPEGSFAALRSGMADPKDVLFQQRWEQMTGGGGSMSGIDPRTMAIAGMTGDFGKLQPAPITKETVQTPQGQRIKTFDQLSGKEISDLGEAPEEKISPEQAGRMQGLKQAQDLVGAIRDMLTPNGEVDRAALFNAFSKMPFTQGRQVRFQYMDAIDSVLRARTGAAATDEEMKRMLNQMMPSPLDDDETVKDKIDRMDSFTGGALEAITLPPRIKKEWEKAQLETRAKAVGKGNTITLPNGVTVRQIE